MVQKSAAAEQVAHISFRQLKLFDAIGTLKSVRRASEECSLSQPAVTQALAKLEEQVGVTLVERRASGSYLNELGALFHARVRRFFDQVEQAIADLGGCSPAAARPIVNRLTRAQIRTLIATVESGSFEPAAESLGISRASLQRAARDLEGNLHQQLFYRTALGMLVTPAGRGFGRKMKLAMQELEWGLEEVEAARGGISQQIVIGAMPYGGSVLLASVLDDFLRMHSKADIRITNDSASELSNSLRAGAVDFVIGLLSDNRDPELVSEPLRETPYSIVGRSGHPLTRKGQVTPDDLIDYDWVVGTNGSSRRACFERLFADGKGPGAQIATCAIPVIRHLLLRSDRLTLMTSYELLHENGQLRAVPFTAMQPAPWIGITMRANWLPTRVHLDFLAVLREHVATPVHEIVRKAG